MSVAADTLIGIGAVLMLLAGLGVLRLPDVFSRMHAGTKAASLGLACILVGVALEADAPTAAKLVAAILFQFSTAPVAAHVIGRAAYRAGIPLWEGTLLDELARADEEADRER